MESVFIESKITGGHYALKNDGHKPFQNNMKECMSIKLNNSDIVADIGAYIGEYSMYAARNGAHQVLSYEPTPNTFKILLKNTLPNMELFNAAVVGHNEKTTDLYISKGIGVTNSIAKSYKKAGKITVPAIKYEDALKNATVVKIDVEGAEYGYNIIQPQLRAIILEFHPISKMPWESWAKKIIKNIKDAGFKTVMEPAFTHGWSLTGSWVK